MDGASNPTTYRIGVELADPSTTWITVETGERAPVGVLGDRIPTSVMATTDGRVLAGGEAAGLPAERTRQVERDLLGRLGQAAPVVVQGTPYGVEALLGLVLASILRAATRHHGPAAGALALVLPDGFDDYRTGLLVEAARSAGVTLDEVVLVPRDEAVARHARAGLAVPDGFEAAAGAALVAAGDEPVPVDVGGDAGSVAAGVVTGTALGAGAVGVVAGGAPGAVAAAPAAFAGAPVAAPGAASAYAGAPLTGAGAGVGAAGSAMPAPGLAVPGTTMGPSAVGPAGTPLAAPGVAAPGAPLPPPTPPTHEVEVVDRARPRIPRPRRPAVIASAATAAAAVTVGVVVLANRSPESPTRPAAAAAAPAPGTGVPRATVAATVPVVTTRSTTASTAPPLVATTNLGGAAPSSTLAPSKATTASTAPATTATVVVPPTCVELVAAVAAVTGARAAGGEEFDATTHRYVRCFGQSDIGSAGGRGTLFEIWAFPVGEVPAPLLDGTGTSLSIGSFTPNPAFGPAANSSPGNFTAAKNVSSASRGVVFPCGGFQCYLFLEEDTLPADPDISVLDAGIVQIITLITTGDGQTSSTEAPPVLTTAAP